jgi:thiamine biosynthesis lipoprotein
MRRFLTLLAAVWLLAACGSPEPWRTESYVFGTRVELAVAGVPEARARAAADRVLRDFDVLHRTYHAWQPSELSALNAAIAAGRHHEVSAEFAAYIREAQAVAAAGEHLFDPGIGRLIALWGFHADEIQPRLPDADGTQGAGRAQAVDRRPEPGWQPGQQPQPGRRARFRRLSEGRRARSRGGLAQGRWHSQRAGQHRRQCHGPGHARRRRHAVARRHPASAPAAVGGAPLATLELRDGEAIGTSGDYHRYFEVDGRRYCHLLDPRSGYPAAGTQAVTVLIAPGKAAGMRSDALSKPIFIAGADWRAMARKLGVEAVLRVGADGTASVTPAMQARLKIDQPDLKLALVP